MRLRWLWIIGLGAACLTNARHGQAEKTDSSRHGQAEKADAALVHAREVFRQGLSLESARDWASALAKFREVAAVRSTAQVRFHIARCQEQLGQLNEARGAYELAMSEATGPDRDEIISWAAPAVEALDARIPRLIVHRGKGAEAVRVKLNGAELGSASIGNPIRLDPGGHELVLSEGSAERSITLTLEESEIRNYEIEPLVKREMPIKREQQTKSERSILPWVAFGTAGASFATATVFYFLMEDKRSELRDVCGSESVCPRSAQPIIDDGKRYALFANVGAVVGGLAAAGGVVLWLTDKPSQKSDTARTFAKIRVAGTSATLEGNF